MAKRFIDTKMWDKSWYRKLSPEHKLLWIYILTKCDHAGILDGDWEAAGFFMGCKISIHDFPEPIKNKMVSIDDDQFFIPSFIEYQYGVLRENSKPHLSVLKRLRDKHLDKYIDRVTITLKDKDKEKVKEKDIVKRKVNFELEVWKVSKESKHKGEQDFEKHIEGFIEYWTEPNRSNSKMKCELQETFNIALRLNKWFKNVQDWNVKSKGEKDVRTKMQFSGRTTLH